MSLSRTDISPFKYYGTVSVGSGAVPTPASKGDDKAWYADQSLYVRRVNLSTLTEEANVRMYANTGSAYFAFINAASGVGVISMSGASTPTVNFIELSTMYTTGLTNLASNYPAPSNGSSKLIASDISRGVVLWASNTAGSINKVTTSGTLSTYTPTSLSGSGVKASCIIQKYSDDSASVFLVGTTDGKIFEFTHTGTEVGTFTLPQPVNRNSSVYPSITDMVYDNNLDRLLVTTKCGLMLLYNWSDKTLLDQYSIPIIDYSTDIPNANVFSINASGSVIQATWDSTYGRNVPICIMSFGASSIFTDTIWDFYLSTSAEKSRCVGWDTTYNKVFIITDAWNLHVFNLDPTKLLDTQIETRAQEPIGINSPHTIRRFKKGQYITSMLDVSASMDAGTVTTLGKKISEYIELSEIDNTYDCRSTST